MGKWGKKIKDEGIEVSLDDEKKKKINNSSKSYQYYPRDNSI